MSLIAAFFSFKHNGIFIAGVNVIVSHLLFIGFHVFALNLVYFDWDLFHQAKDSVLSSSFIFSGSGNQSSLSSSSIKLLKGFVSNLVNMRLTSYNFYLHLRFP